MLVFRDLQVRPEHSQVGRCYCREQTVGAVRIAFLRAHALLPFLRPLARPGLSNGSRPWSLRKTAARVLRRADGSTEREHRGHGKSRHIGPTPVGRTRKPGAESRTGFGPEEPDPDGWFNASSGR